MDVIELLGVRFHRLPDKQKRFQGCLLPRTQHPFTLIVDEFQEFFQINPAVYSEIQHLWDITKGKCHLNLICIGSVYSLMHRIFEEKNEPLFGRADRILSLQPFPIRTIHEILADHGITGERTLFDCYVLTGGMPKYLDLLTANNALSFNR